jgi:hypothetical protein
MTRARAKTVARAGRFAVASKLRTYKGLNDEWQSYFRQLWSVDKR